MSTTHVTPSTTAVSDLLRKNRAWAAEISARDPAFFPTLERQQSPHYLWIGCSDSRVPANQIVGMLPGELFVHRNVANVVVHTDLNCLSVLQYAVEVLKVEHVIVCGHYGCGGVQAALENRQLGLIDNWLRHVQDVAHLHRSQLDRITEAKQRLNTLCELNVIEQVVNVCRTTIVQQAWARGQALTIHGWVYGLLDGLIKDLGISVRDPDDLAVQHAQAVNELKHTMPQLNRANGVPEVPA
ncbi:MAG: carbonate dehydratase [Herpetosiphonaceae bacterium]|nr:carbonate dehydratase [Herpetosiphonaceae bacterium]